MVVHFTKSPEATIPTRDFNRPEACPAKAMQPEQRGDMATHVLGGKESASQAARDKHGNRLRVAVKRLSGLISDLAEFGAQLAAIMSAVKGMS